MLLFEMLLTSSRAIYSRIDLAFEFIYCVVSKSASGKEGSPSFSLLAIPAFLHSAPPTSNSLEDTITTDAPNNTNNRIWRGTEGAEVEGEVAVSSPAITLTEECRRSSRCQVKQAIDMLLPGNNRSAGIM